MAGDSEASGGTPQAAVGEQLLPPLPAQQEQQHAREEQYTRTIEALERRVSQLQMLGRLQQSEVTDMEWLLRETERQRREFATRYAFVVLDADHDGFISVEQVEEYELFSSYAPRLLHAAFRLWHPWASGFPGFLNIDDFVRFVEFAEDRSTRAAQRFWFAVLDGDGDGRLSRQDMREHYDDALRRAAAGGGGSGGGAAAAAAAGCPPSFEDLVHQVEDMVGRGGGAAVRGFTAAELWASRLGAGIIGLLTNHNSMLVRRSTAEWGRGDYPL